MIELFHGDCLIEMNKIPDKSVNLILADLPYGKTRCPWDSIIPLADLWAQYWRIIVPNGAILLFGIEPFSSQLRINQIKFYRYDLIWKKRSPTGFLNANKMPLRSHENISVFYKKLPTYNPQKTSNNQLKKSTRSMKSSLYGKADKISCYSSIERFPTTIFEYGNDKQISALHPTQKPIALLETLIKTYSNHNDVIMDNVMGSGSTGIAAINTNRKFIGIEKDNDFFLIAYNRIFKSKKMG